MSLWLIAGICTYVLTGCSNKINESGSWLVKTDTTLIPVDSVITRATSSEIVSALPTGSSAEQCVGSVPWTQTELLLQFNKLDSLYYAKSFVYAEITLTRGTYVLQPPGYNVLNMQFSGYEMDSAWNIYYTWDSVAAAHRGTKNIVVGSPSIDDSLIIINIDTAVIRQWAKATQDSAVSNNGFLLVPQNISGIFSIYSFSSSTYLPELSVAYYDTNGVEQSFVSTSGSSNSVAHSTITNVVPSGPYRILQSAAEDREKLIFDLTHIPNLSIVNFAELTLFEDPSDSVYSGNSIDSLVAYHITDPSTNAVDYSSGSALTLKKHIFIVTTEVQQMLNTGNYGFIITPYDESGNADVRFIYDENAPDSLKPRLSITYAPAVKK